MVYDYDPWESYFNELCLVLDSGDGRNVSRYTSLLWQLHNTEFKATMRMDENRIVDALEYRRRHWYGDVDRPACVLELMVSLATRLETDVMAGTAEHDRASDWFWVMVDSLGLAGMTNDAYDEMVVSKVLRRFMRRRYLPNGKGGLFTVPNSDMDMRKQDIWYQAALYLTGILRMEGFIES